MRRLDRLGKLAMASRDFHDGFRSRNQELKFAEGCSSRGYEADF